MTAFEDRITESALRQLTKYGKTVTLQRAPAAVYDTATSSYTEGAKPAAETFKALANDFDGGQALKLGVQIKSGDKLLLIAAKSINAPSLGDSFLIDGKTYLIVPKASDGLEIKTVYAGEVPALYYVHGRCS